MNQTTPTLLVTPWHEPTESLLGYVLRVSERNGYDSPWHIMGLAGLSQGEMRSPGFPVEQFAAIVGRKPENLHGLAYQGADSDGKRQFQLLGHSLGSLRSNPLRLNRPQLCPRCVQEHGYIDAFFDLSLAVACPDHGRTLINACPSCTKPITWFRQGLLTCKCGADLAAADTVEVSAELNELMAVIRTKLHGKSLTPMDNACGFPLEELDPILLRHLLEKLTALGRCNLSSSGQGDMDQMSILQSASELLQDWPNAFRALLRRQRKPDTPTSRLSKQYADLFSSLLLDRHKRLPDTDFLLKELTNFAKTEWNGVISWQLVKDDSNGKRFLSKAEMASRMGVDGRTLKQWVERNIFPVKVMKVGAQNRYVFDTEATEVLPKGEGKSLGERQAAAHVGLPVSVLQSLRGSGHFDVRFLASRLTAFHERDLDAFVEKMLALGDCLEEAPANTISLEEVMRLKFRSPEGKGDFVRALLGKTLDTMGRLGETIGSLLFPADQVESFLRDHRARGDGNSWSMKEAAKFLHCDPGAVLALSEEGILDAVDSAYGKRVTEKSVKEFDAEYVSLAILAKDFGTCSRKLQSTLSAQHFTLKMVNCGYGRVAQPFILRSDYRQAHFI